MARTTGWVTAIWETQRQAIMQDDAWQGGDYDEQPDGFRSAIGSLMVWVRHWHWMDEEFADDNMDAVEWLHEQEDALMEVWDANNYIYQTRAEDRHDISEAPGREVGYEEALASMEVHALIMPGTKDILHPPDDSRLAAEQMPNARLVEIDSDHGHLGGGGVDQDDIDLINEEMTSFFNELRD